MPIAHQFHTAQIQQLAQQIIRAPESIRREQMRASEILLREIEEERLYPFEYVQYRITGYRGDDTEQSMLLGSPLLGDLVALIAIVSRTLHISSSGMLSVKESSSRLGISQRTLSRLRHEGLVFYWVNEKSGRQRLGCTVELLEQFKERHCQRLQTASQFSRLSKIEQRDIVELALQYEGKGRTLSEVASELSKQSTRGHETIRSLLQKTPEVLSKIPKGKRLSRDDTREIEQEIKGGASWNALTSKYQRSASALRKAVARLRLNRLRSIQISYVELKVFSREDAEDVILAPQIVNCVPPPLLVLDSLESNAGRFADDGEETALISAMHLLRRRALQQLHLLKYSPSEHGMDRIETDLRWSFLLQQRLILQALPSSLAVLVQHVGRPLHELPSSRLLPLLKRTIEVIGKACGELDPSKSQNASRTPASILDRQLSIQERGSKPKQAAAMYKPIHIECPFHECVAWSYLIPTQNLPSIAQRQSIELETLVALKFGWQGKPRTCSEITQEVNRSEIWVRRQLRTWI